MSMEFWDAVYEFERAYDVCRKDVMRRFELSAAEVDILLFLTGNSQHNTASDVERLTPLTKSHISLAVGQLVQKGLVSRTADERNRKRLHLTLTPAADAIAAYGSELRQEFFAALLDGFSEEEKARFAAMCCRIIDNLRRGREGRACV